MNVPHLDKANQKDAMEEWKQSAVIQSQYIY